MKTVIILSLLILSAFATVHFEDRDLRELYTQWKRMHNKVYATYEEESRYNTFKDNYVKIVNLNAIQYDVKLALNQFADLTTSEYAARFTGYTPSARRANVQTAHFDSSKNADAVDWRTKGAVTPIKNQGQCGSCWAFSAVGALEGFNFINTGKLVSFSEQQLVDCVTADQGCGGGLMEDAFAYTAQAGGIETEEDYPYKGKNQKCAFDAAKATKVNTGYKNVTHQSADQLKAALNVQPVSVAIDAGSLFFQFYRSGVLKRFCGNNLNHGVLAVGYDSTAGSEAFIVKNSWGTIWGDKGYVRISTDGSANHGDGVCGILADANFPTNN